jgi:hypothetical protein
MFENSQNTQNNNMCILNLYCKYWTLEPSNEVYGYSWVTHNSNMIVE